MMSPLYRDQVTLLLRILPFVAQESCFALKGGTAINLFVRDMPRLSVDIDLVYLPFDDRAAAAEGIALALERIQQRLKRSIPESQIRLDRDKGKLVCALGRVQVKVEVNTVMRGHSQPTRLLGLTPAVQYEFGLFSEIKVVSDGELYGGKLCAALDRQHPRDLFDVVPLLVEPRLNDDIKNGFIASLLSHDRPIHEVLQPRFQDHEQTFKTQFAGMARTPFTYDDFLHTRLKLVQTVQASLNEQDKALLVSFKQGEPDWSLSPLEALSKLPAVQWKLQNIQKLALQNPAKHLAMLNALKSTLNA